MGSDGLRRCPVCGGLSHDYYESDTEHGWSCDLCGSSDHYTDFPHSVSGDDSNPIDVYQYEDDLKFGYGCVEYAIDDGNSPVEKFNQHGEHVKRWVKRNLGETKVADDEYQREVILFESSVYQGKMVILHWVPGYSPISLHGMKFEEDPTTGKLYLIPDCDLDMASLFKPVQSGFLKKNIVKELPEIMILMQSQIPIYERLIQNTDWSVWQDCPQYNKYDVIYTTAIVWDTVTEIVERGLESVIDNYQDIVRDINFKDEFEHRARNNLGMVRYKMTGFGDQHLDEFFKDTKSIERVYNNAKEWIKKRNDYFNGNDVHDFVGESERILKDLKENGPKIAAIQNGMPYLEVIIAKQRNPYSGLR